MNVKPYDGGAAFARPASEDTRDGDLFDGNRMEDAQAGMTLRDWFAGLSLQAILGNAEALRAIPPLTHAERAEAAYKAADAMLKERKKLLTIPDQAKETDE